MTKKRTLWRQHKRNPSDTVLHSKYRQCQILCRQAIHYHENSVESRIVNSNNLGTFCRYINKHNVTPIMLHSKYRQCQILCTYDVSCKMYPMQNNGTGNAEIAICLPTITIHWDKHTNSRPHNIGGRSPQ